MRELFQSKSFCAAASARSRAAAANAVEEADAEARATHSTLQHSATSHGLQTELSGKSNSSMRRLSMLGSRKSYSQLALKEALNIQQYPFVKECSDGPQLEPPPLFRSQSRRRSSHMDPISRLASWDSTISMGPELLEAMKSVSGAEQQEPGSSSTDILGAMEQAAQGELEQANTIVVSPKLPAAMLRARWSIKDYAVIRNVHKGYASDVYEATCSLTGKRVALKAYVVENMEDIPRVQLAREIRLHAMCDHPNIIQFYAAFVEELRDGQPGVHIKAVGDPGPHGASGAARPRQGCRVVVLVVEWAGRGDLSRFMKKQGGSLTEAKAINLVLLPLLKSLHYLHSKNIVHRDIKPENMIFDEEMVLKMADFGLALDLTEERANTRAGTLDYMAPEVLMCPTKQTPADFKFDKGARHYATGADAWAAGAIFYELLVGSPPFRSSSTSATARHIINCDVVFPPKVSDAAQSFITACLNLDPSERPTVVQLIEHELLQEMRERAQFRIAAMRSNSFVEFIAKQQKHEQLQQQRSELNRQGSQGAYLDSLLADEEDEDESDEGYPE